MLNLRRPLVFLFLLITALAAQAQPDSTRKPNVILIMADDLGYSDIGCYGSEIATPNLDALAKGGLRFTQFYNTARCWPTRGALLTGYYAQQVKRDSMAGVAKGARPAWGKLLPARLKDLGYRSYHSGKWHIDGGPLAGGFDRAYDLANHNNHFGSKPGIPGGSTYSSIAAVDHAISCLKDHAVNHAGKPFFTYLAFTAPHFPLHAPMEDIAIYKDRYVTGYEALRAERFARMTTLGFGGFPLSAVEPNIGPPYAFPADLKKLGPNEINRPLSWASLSPAQKAFQSAKMPIHAAMIDRMDREIGRLIAQVKAMNAFDDTLILFLSDNGATAEMMVRGAGHSQQAAPGSAATFLCLGPGWSGAANTPFRRHKTWVHEGGISTPLIAHWPKGITAQGELRRTPGHVIDIVPTILQLAGGSFGSAPASPGKSLAPAFAADVTIPRNHLWWLHEGNKALREGDWKIVASAGKPWELYDLSKDRAETNNLAAQMPERVQQLAARWQAQSAAIQALAK